MIAVTRAAAVLAAALVAAPPAAANPEDPWAATAWAGVLTTEDWHDAMLFPWTAELQDGGLVAATLSRRLAEAPIGPAGGLEGEAEATLDRYWGSQDVFTLAVAGTARWRLPGEIGSAAFAFGLSAASETPEAEVAVEGDSRAVMIYWAIEAEAGPVNGWSLAARLHHRSTGYGLFGEDGGANAFLLGLRRRF